jgi:hypothetical protein
MQTSKIARLPAPIREQLNRRLDDSESSDSLLPWLNSLPETQAIINAEFDHQPITRQNLDNWKKAGFRRWQVQQAALEFAAEPPSGQSGEQSLAIAPLLENLVRWISLRLAAVAQSSPIPEDPGDELRDIRSFVADIVALRRGDLVSRRISLEELRLSATQAKSEQEMEKLFWLWTRRPDIQAQLFPHRDPDKLRRDVVRMLDRELLGRNHAHDEPEPDPACAI